MKVRAWLASTCSSSTSTTTADDFLQIPTPSRKLYSDSSSSSDSTTLSSDTTYSGLQSNLSLQTNPSVPSLQKLSPDNFNLSVTHHCLSSLNPSPRYHVNFLTIHNNLLYAASGNVINVLDFTTSPNELTLIETFGVADSASGSVKSVTFSNNKIFTAHQDCKIRVWKLTESKGHKQVATLPTLEDRLRRAILPKNYVNVRRHKKRLWIQHNDAVSGLAVTGDDQFMCSVSWDKCLKIWRTSDSRCVENIKAHDDAINAVAISPDGTIYTGSADRLIKVWGKTLGEKKHGLIATLEKHKSAVNALALNGDGSVLFSGACDRSILVWEKEDSANHMLVTGALRGHTKAILCLINVSDLLLSGSGDRAVRVWKRGHDAKFCCLTVLDGHEKPVRSLVAVPVSVPSWVESGNGTTNIKVFSGSFDGEIKVWEVMVSNPGTSPLSNSSLVKWKSGKCGLYMK